MGRGVMEPDLRGPKARRLLAAEELAHGFTKGALAASTENATNLCRTIGNLTEKVKGAQIEIDLWKATAEVAQDEVNRLTREEAAIPYLMDMSAEMVAANIAAHNAAMEAMKDAENARAEQAKVVAEEE